MTTLHAGAETRVQKDHLYSAFTGCGATMTHIGAEGEFFIGDKDGKNYATPDQIQALIHAMQVKGHLVQTEACGVLEINTPPFDTTQMDAFYKECLRAEHDLKSAVHDHGFTILHTAIPPFILQEDAEQFVIPRDRIRDMIAAVKRLLPPDALRVGLLTSSSQVSIDYNDPQDLYKKLHRGYALSPLLIYLFASDTGLMEGQRMSTHIRSGLYQSYGERASGIPSYFKGCDNGEELITTHLEQLCETPLLYYYDNGQVVYPASLSETFNSLTLKGLNTMHNLEAAESFLYHDIKFKPLPNGKRRLEFRLADTGFGHMQAVGALISTLVCSASTAPIFDQILKDFGFQGDLPRDLYLMNVNRMAAVQNPTSPFIPFGNGTLYSLFASIRQKLLPNLDSESEATLILNDLLHPDRKSLRARYQCLTEPQLTHAIVM